MATLSCTQCPSARAVSRVVGLSALVGVMSWGGFAAAATTGGSEDTTEQAAEETAEQAADGAGATSGDREPFHESTAGPPLYRGPVTDQEPLTIELDDDGMCRVGPGSPSGVGCALLLVLLGLRRASR